MGKLDDRARLRIRRLAEGPPKITQERLAEIGGWNHQTGAGKWLNRVHDADLDTLDRLAKWFGITLCDLLRPEEPEPADPETATVMRLYRGLSKPAQAALVAMMASHPSQGKQEAPRPPRKKKP